VVTPVFCPPPAIYSGLARIALYPPRELPAMLWPLIDAAFAHRRKPLRAALSGFYGSGQAAEQALRAANIEPTQRGEKLSIDAFVRLATVEASLDSSRDHESEEDNEGATHE